MELPELPETVRCNPANYCLSQHIGLFTADQMCAYTLEAIAAERERCAVLAEEQSKFAAYAAGASIQDRIAAAIRAQGSKT